MRRWLASALVVAAFPAVTTVAAFPAVTTVAAFPAVTTVAAFPAVTTVAAFPAVTTVAAFPAVTAAVPAPQRPARAAAPPDGTAIGPTVSVTDRLDERRFVAAGARAYELGSAAGRYPAMGFHTRGEMGGIWTPPIKLLD